MGDVSRRPRWLAGRGGGREHGNTLDATWTANWTVDRELDLDRDWNRDLDRDLDRHLDRRLDAEIADPDQTIAADEPLSATAPHAGLAAALDMIETAMISVDGHRQGQSAASPVAKTRPSTGANTGANTEANTGARPPLKPSPYPRAIPCSMISTGTKMPASPNGAPSSLTPAPCRPR